MKIKHVMTVVGGGKEVTVQVDEDKRPGGLQRMRAQAIQEAAAYFPRGMTLQVKCNWAK